DGVFGDAPQKANLLVLSSADVRAFYQGFQVGRVAFAARLDANHAAVGIVLVAVNGVTHLPQVAVKLRLFLPNNCEPDDRKGGRGENKENARSDDQLKKCYSLFG